ncbi:ribonuclease H family protein [Lactobacillaceae bacterium Scapto_B20]
MPNKYYAVRRGRKPGIYNSWPECQEQVTGFNGARFKGFTDLDEAKAFVDGQDLSTTSQSTAKPMKDAIVVYTDGGSRNHGNQKGKHVKTTDKASWAYLIITADGKRSSDSDGELGATNNRMEIMALIKALQSLLDQNLQSEPVQVISDSKYVLDSITKHWLSGWQRRGWQTSTGQPVKNEQLWRQVAELLKQFPNIQYQWTKGHADDPGNQFVDDTLNQTMDEMGKSGTIKIAQPAPKSVTPQADENVKQNALKDIDSVLNGGQAPNSSKASSADAHPLSSDESVKNLNDAFKDLNFFNDKDN